MTRYLIRVKGETAIYCRKNASRVDELQDLVDMDDDPAAFEFTEDRKREADRDWRSLVPPGERYFPGIGTLPAGAFSESGAVLGCGVSD